MKTTTILSLPSFVTERILKSLQINEIPCKYLGLDHADRLLMEIAYTNSQSQLVNTLIQHIEESEAVMREVKEAINKAIQTCQHQLVTQMAKKNNTPAILN